MIVPAVLLLAVPAIADSPDTQQSASSGISHDLSHSSWKEVGHAVWPKDGEKKRSSSASLSIPRRSVKGVMSPRKEKERSKSPTGSSPSKTTQENKTLKQEVEEAKRNLAMLQESVERDDQGNAGTGTESRYVGTTSSPYPQKIRRTTSRSCSLH